MMTAEIALPLDKNVLDKLLIEERSWDGGRAKVDVTDSGFRVTAPDSASLRAALNAVLKIIQVHEQMEKIA